MCVGTEASAPTEQLEMELSSLPLHRVGEQLVAASLSLPETMRSDDASGHGEAPPGT